MMLAHANTVSGPEHAPSALSGTGTRSRLDIDVAANGLILETPDGLKYFEPSRQAAFLGLLRAHGELTRALEAELSGSHGITLSAYEILSRLAHAPERSLRVTHLAGQAGLSISRVSRLVDQLEARGLVGRRTCAEDSRFVHVDITDDGRDLLRFAQDTFFDVVEDRFLGRLSCDEVETLGGLLARVNEREAD